MRNKTGALPAAMLILCLCGIATGQKVQVAVTVQGLAGNNMTFTLDQVRQMPQHSVSIVNVHNNATEKYEGPLLADLLAKVGTPSGDKLRGDEMRDYVEVTGKDGYKAVFALAELDRAIQDTTTRC